MSQKHTPRAILLVVLTMLGCSEPAVKRVDEIARVDVVLPTQAPANAVIVEATPAPVPEPKYPNVVVQAAKLCWNESNDSLTDCAAIVHMRMRSAISHNRTLEQELYFLHGDGRTRARNHASLRSDRATNPRRGDTRSWLGDVTADLHQPFGWPGTAEEWAVRASRLDALFQYVARIIGGQVPYPCRGSARRWGGGMDHDLIEMWKQRGEHVLNCGGTRNTFLGSI